MPFRPPLTLEQLHEIAERGRGNSDVVSLLWEVKRLQAHVLRLDQLCRSIPDIGGAVRMIVDAARSEIAQEPVVLQQRQDWQELNGAEPGDDEP